MFHVFISIPENSPLLALLSTMKWKAMLDQSVRQGEENKTGVLNYSFLFLYCSGNCYSFCFSWMSEL